MNEGLTGLEQTFHFWVNYQFKVFIGVSKKYQMVWNNINKSNHRYFP